MFNRSRTLPSHLLLQPNVGIPRLDTKQNSVPVLHSISHLQLSRDNENVPVTCSTQTFTSSTSTATEQQAKDKIQASGSTGTSSHSVTLPSASSSPQLTSFSSDNKPSPTTTSKNSTSTSLSTCIQQLPSSGCHDNSNGNNNGGTISDSGGYSTATGLSLLVEKCLGKPLDKSEQLSDWERRPLREKQIRYAGQCCSWCILL